VALKDSQRDVLRRVLFGAQHPVEKLKRIALGPLTLEGLPPGHYRTLGEREIVQLRRALTAPAKAKTKTQHRAHRASTESTEKTRS
jgi:23S rRNA pseudouridine2605 synthase/16S rRNA pseudouridine516 synthase